VVIFELVEEKESMVAKLFVEIEMPARVAARQVFIGEKSVFIRLARLVHTAAGTPRMVEPESYLITIDLNFLQGMFRNESQASRKLELNKVPSQGRL